MSGTLFLSDMDGTLLDGRAHVSSESAWMLNTMLGEGLAFTCATARNRVAHLSPLHNLELRLPVILMNGVLVFDQRRRVFLQRHEISPSAVRETLEILRRYGHGATVFSTAAQVGRATGEWEPVHAAQLDFQGGKTDALPSGEAVVFFNFFERKEAARPICDELNRVEGLRVEFYHDVYSENYCVEISSDRASKSGAALFLKEHFGFSKLVCFGDNLNDLSMFEGADECFAVENAKPQVRARANRVIASNLSDGVARYLWDRFHAAPTQTA